MELLFLLPHSLVEERIFLSIDLTFSVKFEINIDTSFLCLIFDKLFSVQNQSKKPFPFFNI